MVSLKNPADFGNQFLIGFRCFPIPKFRIDFVGKFIDCIDGNLHLIGPKTTAPSITSSGRILASDSTINTAFEALTTTKSNCDLANSALVGFKTYTPFT